MLRDAFKGLYLNIDATPSKNFMVFVMIDAYGLVKDGKQHILLSDYDPQTKFYKMFNVEYHIRWIADELKNAYVVAFLRCDKVTHYPKRHTGIRASETEETLKREGNKVTAITK